MTPLRREVEAELEQISSLASPLGSPSDLDRLVDAIGEHRFVCLGGATHGTHELYAWRAALTRRLVAERGARWIAVDADWGDCRRIDRWVRGVDHRDLDAEGLLAGFERWPTWMWANEDVAHLLTWLRTWNDALPEDERVGVHGLDAYSRWDSLRTALSWLEARDPEALPGTLRAWRDFTPYVDTPDRYAWDSPLVPAAHEAEVVGLLADVRRRALAVADADDLDTAVAAVVSTGAETYYRAVLRADRDAWNVRERHLADTLDLVAAHHGPASRGVVWEHDAHVGDARGTDMTEAGLVSLGQLVRESHRAQGVSLVGLGAHRGTVVAAEGWGRREHAFGVPEARHGSHDWMLHTALRRPSVLVLGDDRSGPWLTSRRGHREIGVVYDPWAESGSYVPTVIGVRFDALLWFESARAVRPTRLDGALGQGTPGR